MEALRQRLYFCLQVIYAWMEFGFLCVAAAFIIPIYTAICLTLLILPLLYIAFASQSHLLLALYLFAVFGGVAIYCIYKFVHRADPNVPRQGRPMETEARAERRSRSLISKNSNSRRRR